MIPGLTQRSGTPNPDSSSRGRASRFRNPFAWHLRRRNFPEESESPRPGNQANSDRSWLCSLPTPADACLETRTVESADLHFDDQSFALLDTRDEIKARAYTRVSTAFAEDLSDKRGP